MCSGRTLPFSASVTASYVTRSRYEKTSSSVLTSADSVVGVSGVCLITCRGFVAVAELDACVDIRGLLDIGIDDGLTPVRAAAACNIRDRINSGTYDDVVTD